MRVCFIAYKFYETAPSLSQFATALVRSGVNVDVVSLRRDQKKPYQNQEGVHVFGIKRRQVDEQSRFSYLWRVVRFSFLATLKVSCLHLRSPYSVVHVQSAPDFLVFAALIPKLCGTSIIFEAHDIGPEFYASKFSGGRSSFVFRLLILIERMAASFADHILVPNDLWYSKLIGRSTHQRKCSVIRYLPDQKLFARAEPTRNDGKFIILYPGTLNWHQGLDIGVRAFAKVAARIPEAEFHIYGEGPSKRYLTKLIRQLNLVDKVKLFDMLPRDQIVKVIANADVGLVPKNIATVFGDEAMSTKIAEFMALGVPVIATRSKVESYYYDDSTIRFVGPGREDEMAESLLELYRNADLRKSLVSSSLAYSSKNNWEFEKCKYLSLISNLGVRAERTL